MPSDTPPPDARARPGRDLVPVWAALLAGWLVLLVVLPDPRPLAAPEWAIRRMEAASTLSEPMARAVVAIAFRAAGIAVLGLLASLALSRLPLRRAALATLVGTPCLAVAVKWLNFGYFPVASQLAFIVAVALASALAGLTLRRSRLAMVALGAFGAGLFAWGTSTRITDDLYAAARVTGERVIEGSRTLPADEPDRFARLTTLAFAYAEDNSHGVDPVFANRAAILALGVILGDDQVASVARRELDAGRRIERNALRQQVLVHGRTDLSQHFWVSAALVVLADANRSLAIGLAKEAKDSNPGGSGFSFVDMLANKAGIRFAVVAGRDADAARDLQLRIARGIGTGDLVPPIDGLPEGLSRDEFQSGFGGIGGAETRRLFAEIDRRIAGLPPLQPSP